MKVVILGSGFASLKIATLISHDLKQIKGQITIVSSTKYFIFLPLIPNFVDRSCKNGLSDLFVDLEEFCSSRGIRFINQKITEQYIKSDHILVQNEQLDFDLLFDGRGKSKNQGENTYKFWGNFVQSVDAGPLNKNFLFQNPGIAEFEIIQALKSRLENLNIQFMQSQRSFISHPQLKNILNPKRMKPRWQISDSIHIKEDIMVKGKRILLGGALAKELNCESTAQFASFSAKVGYKLYLLKKKCFTGDSVRKLKKKSFRQRGKMLYINKNSSYIWLGEDSKMRIKPHIRGKIGYLFRKQFYVSQMKLFYSAKVNKRAIWVYKFFLNTF